MKLTALLIFGLSLILALPTQAGVGESSSTNDQVQNLLLSELSRDVLKKMKKAVIQYNQKRNDPANTVALFSKNNKSKKDLERFLMKNGVIRLPKARFKNGMIVINTKGTNVTLDVPDIVLGSIQINGVRKQLKGTPTTMEGVIKLLQDTFSTNKKVSLLDLIIPSAWAKLQDAHIIASVISLMGENELEKYTWWETNVQGAEAKIEKNIAKIMDKMQGYKKSCDDNNEESPFKFKLLTTEIENARRSFSMDSNDQFDFEKYNEKTKTVFNGFLESSLTCEKMVTLFSAEGRVSLDNLRAYGEGLEHRKDRRNRHLQFCKEMDDFKTCLMKHHSNNFGYDNSSRREKAAEFINTDERMDDQIYGSKDYGK